MTQIEAMDGRVAELDIQIREFKAQGQIALTYKDMMVRYGVKETKARAILRAIRSVCGGGKLGQGRVLPSEVLYWEGLVIKANVRL